MTDHRILLTPHILQSICKDLTFEEAIQLYSSSKEYLNNLNCSISIDNVDKDKKIKFLPGVNNLTITAYQMIKTRGSKYTFMQAIRTKRLDLLEMLIKAGFDYKASTNNYSSMFEFAITTNQLPALQLLLKKGTDPNNPKQSYEYFLYLAAILNQPEIVKYFLSLGVDINAQEPIGQRTVLMGAVNRRNKQLIKYLLDQGADPNIAPSLGYSILSEALQSNDLEIIKMLVEAGADPRIPFNGGVILYLVGDLYTLDYNPKRTIQIMKYLLDQGVDINHQNIDDQTALSLAADDNDVDYVKFLISQGADPAVGDWSERARQNFQVIMETN